jgi:chromosome partitioning protein
MSKVIAISSNKGGVGKTTTAVNLAASLPGNNLLIDFDPQGNASINLGVNPDEKKNTIFSMLVGRATFNETFIITDWCDLLPANDDLSELDMILIQNKDKVNPVTLLSDTLVSHRGDYDYIIIDLPPSKGLLTINALTASTDVIIPMQCEYLATAGVSKIIDTIRKVQQSYNPDLNILGIVATMYNVRTNLSSIVLQEARKFFLHENIKVFDTVIHRSIKFAESSMLGKPAIEAYQDTEAVQCYNELAKEILKWQKI